MVLKALMEALMEGAKHVFKRTFTLKYPYEKLELPDGYHGRHLLYLDRCTGCGICAWICPEKCITLVEVPDGEWAQNPTKRFPQYFYGRCCFCHFCTDYCPTHALDYTKDYELSEYDKNSLVWSPRRLAKVPERYRETRQAKIHGWTGVDHEPVEST